VRARGLKRVRLAISMGDPGGIGPEVTLKALVARQRPRGIEPLLVGDPSVWRDTAQRLGLPLAFGTWPDDAPRGRLPMVPTSELSRTPWRPGAPRSHTAARARGEAAYQAILGAVRLVQHGQADGMVTAPISKANVVAAGHDFAGHTELLAQLAGNVPVRMMLAGPQLRVVLVTTHLALAAVPRRLTRAAVLDTIRITVAGLRDCFGLSTPRVAVAGLNPHAGEDGLFGDEERRVIAPAVRTARRSGLRVEGPFAADGLFAHAAGGAYDAVVCMYHDQGLAPFKLLHFADGVNITLGLPFVRTSPDHGTAFDIAGTGRADPRSMIAALALAAAAARHRSARRSKNAEAA
jgi:4-hydroxythreonine-4-phosphate dehydrogenase